MTHEPLAPTASTWESIEGSTEFDEAQASEAARAIGKEMSGMLLGYGFERSLVETFSARVVEPIDVHFDRNDDGNISKYGLWREDDGPGWSILELGRKSVRGWAGHLMEASARTGIKIDEKDAYDLAFGWMIAHELGHGLQEAYAVTHRQVSTNEKYKWQYPEVAIDFIQDHPEEAMGPNVVDGNIIESERQAEGLAKLFLSQLLVEYGLTAEQAQELQDAIYRFKGELASQRQSWLLKTSVKVSFFEIAAKEVVPEGAPRGINAIGYANPLSVEQLLHRFSAPISSK